MDSNQARVFKTSAKKSWEASNETVPKATAISARSVSVSLSSISFMIEKNSSFVTNPVRNGSKTRVKQGIDGRKFRHEISRINRLTELDKSVLEIFKLPFDHLPDGIFQKILNTVQLVTSFI